MSKEQLQILELKARLLDTLDSYNALSQAMMSVCKATGTETINEAVERIEKIIKEHEHD